MRQSCSSKWYRNKTITAALILFVFCMFFFWFVMPQNARANLQIYIYIHNIYTCISNIDCEIRNRERAARFAIEGRIRTGCQKSKYREISLSSLTVMTISFSSKHKLSTKQKTHSINLFSKLNPIVIPWGYLIGIEGNHEYPRGAGQVHDTDQTRTYVYIYIYMYTVQCTHNRQIQWNGFVKTVSRYSVK